MKKFTVLAALLLCMVMMLSMFTACNETPAPADPAEGDNTEATDTPDANDASVDPENTENTDGDTAQENVAEPFDISDVDLSTIAGYAPAGEAVGYIENNGEQVVPEYIMKICGVPVTLEEYRYYYRTLKGWMDGGDETLWGEEAPEESRLTEEDAKSLKDQALTVVKQSTLYHILCNKFGIALTEDEKAEIEASIASIIEQMNAEGSEMTFEEALVADNLTEGLYRYSMNLNTLANKLFESLYFAEGAPYAYAEDEMLQKMKDLGYVRTQQLLVKFPDAPTEGTEEEKAAAVEAGKAEAKAKAEEALAKINAGEDFMSVVKEYNDDPGMDFYGEDGYYFTAGYMVKEYEDASFALEEGGVSDIVETSYGYHIIKRLPMESGYIKANATEYFGNDYQTEFFAKLEATFENMEVEYAPEYELIAPSTVK